MNSSKAERMTGPQTLAYGSEQIDFSLTFSDRQRLSITVETDGRVIVKAPTDATLETVFERLRRKAGWIIRQRDRFAAFGPAMPPKQYVSGETHRYLGRQYRLHVTEGAEARVKLIGRYFEVFTPDKRDTIAVFRLMENWYRSHARRIFSRHIEQCLRSSYFRDIADPVWTIRRMKRRWGSCTNNGTILLNLLLVQASTRCIDYVITHELCHLIIHDHSPEFFRLLGKVMPDYEKRRNALAVQGATYDF